MSTGVVHSASHCARTHTHTRIDTHTHTHARTLQWKLKARCDGRCELRVAADAEEKSAVHVLRCRLLRAAAARVHATRAQHAAVAHLAPVHAHKRLCGAASIGCQRRWLVLYGAAATRGNGAALPKVLQLFCGTESKQAVIRTFFIGMRVHACACVRERARTFACSSVSPTPPTSTQ